MFEFEQRKLPNATPVLVLGILSILTCCCYGVLGIIIGVIALVLYKQDKQLYDKNPSVYENYSNLNTGRILAIIGIVLSIFALLYYIWIFNYIGWENFGDPQKMQERLNELQ
ncbi:hypothetical protein EV195_106214 [Tenacibaculum skagerrakense]|uniref:DUF4190 domain-containing protein n=1 Tax=Tenacibaculum skagerrakense TaxID=186571 RepID=A0A4V2SLR0_9FLAO|nr:CCC motif membrane protein [Tenacibaculum skagerrakense]TCP24406.1 hypothetical protein EV195_106214 [Tenacibaculum skagerrakense]